MGAAVGVVLALAAPPAALAAEIQVGASDRPFTDQAELVPQLRVGSSAARGTGEDGRLGILLPARRCEARGSVTGRLSGSPGRLPKRLRFAGRRSLEVQGAPRTRFTVAAYRFDDAGVDPSSTFTLIGRLPKSVARGQRRRTAVITLSVGSEDEGCLQTLRREARSLLPTLFLRQMPGARPLALPKASPTRRTNRLALDRLGAGRGKNALGTGIAPAGDLDGDGVGDVLFPGGSSFAATGDGSSSLVRFGGGPAGLVDSGRLGSRGLAITGRFGFEGSDAGPAAVGDFDGDGRDDLAASTVGSQRGRGPRPARETIAVVVPGGRYRGRLDTRHPPVNTLRITVKPGCSPLETRVSGVGDVNGDGLDDVAIKRQDGCGPSHAGIIFGGRRATVALDAPGAAGIIIDARTMSGDLDRAGDLNGDGLGDVAYRDTDPDGGADEIIVLLGRRAPGSVSLTREPAAIRLRRRGCGDLVDLDPAGDLNGDGADELAIGISECSGRVFNPVVAFVLKGSPALARRVRLAGPSGTEITSRFGPLNGPQVAAGRDVAGGGASDLALGFASGGPSREGEAWLISDLRLGERLTLGDLGARGSRLIGTRSGEALGSDVAMSRDTTGDGRADLLIGAEEADFAGRERVGSVYTFAATGAAAPRCATRRGGSSEILGTDGGDRIAGSARGDRIVGFMGDDCLSGRGGADRLVGDPGADRIDGGPGPDRLFGGDSRDQLRGGDGDDFLSGGDQPDRLFGGAGADRIDARASSGDKVDAGAGRDLVRSADRAFDVIDCGPGRDRAIADPGDRVRHCERVKRKRLVEYDD